MKKDTHKKPQQKKGKPNPAMYEGIIYCNQLQDLFNIQTLNKGQLGKHHMKRRIT